MRLLNTTSLQIEEFLDLTPSYAILSHTWEEGEILFSDLQDLDRARLKKGFDKLNRACQEALRDGFEWIWIDTCCIDKSSSAELSEAINSMFAWYKTSGKCYAYLADVDDTGSGFEKSKWFTRAWTLQELLAPRNVVFLDHEMGLTRQGMEFFSKGWHSLGSRKELRDKIADATNIDEAYLRGRSLHRASISMRMSWASGRRATRAEDIAYSLLGIFDVNMPLLYGEGKLKAFRRLQEEIMKISEDETLFAWEHTNRVWDLDSGNALARDPKDFVSARDLVPYTSEDPIIPHTLTHRGLRISLQMGNYTGHMISSDTPNPVPPEERFRAAVLRCHVAHDFTHAVVIGLRHLTSNIYQRVDKVGIGLVSTKNLHPLHPISEVYIQSNSKTSIMNSVRRRDSFLIRRLPDGYTVNEVSSESKWDAKDQIVRPPRNVRHATLELVGSLLEQCGHSTGVTYLSLGCTQSGEPAGEWRPWCYVQDQISTPPDGGLQLFHEEISSKIPQLFSDLSSESERLKVKVSTENIMGQRMFIVEVDLNNTNR